MPALLRNILAVLAGIAVGSGVNMAIIGASPSFIAPPPGVDMSTAEGLAAGMHLLQAQHFVMPFLAHALGTLAGALLACLIGATHRAALAWAMGGLFLAGGIAASVMIPAPTWFKALDLLAAYLPMAWLGLWLGHRLRPDPARA